MNHEPKKRETNDGLSPVAIAIGLGTSALVWLVVDALRRLL
jgi:hypothetical protein